MKLRSQAAAYALSYQLKVRPQPPEREYIQFELLGKLEVSKQDPDIDIFVVVLFIWYVGGVTILGVAVSFLLTFSFGL